LLNRNRKIKAFTSLLLVVAVFLGCYLLPIENARFTNAVFEALALVKWYVREHVLLCLVPAFFIAGTISVFVDILPFIYGIGIRLAGFVLRISHCVGGNFFKQVV